MAENWIPAALLAGFAFVCQRETRNIGNNIRFAPITLRFAPFFGVKTAEGYCRIP
jgi:hypothetical protein